MRYKNLFIQIFFIGIISFAYADLSDSNIFPEAIRAPFIELYIDGKTGLSPEELRREYEYILNFLEECITMHYKNIIVYINETSLKHRQPLFVNGQLGFEEIEEVMYSRDKDTGQYREVAAVSVNREIIGLFTVFLTYNQFVEYWYLMTGELLRVKYDVEEEMDKFIAEIKPHDKPGLWISDPPWFKRKYTEKRG